MGKIYYLMGKSASGKDTIFRHLLTECPDLKRTMLYTTRPRRDGERDGVEYYFTTKEVLKELDSRGKVIESRTYQTVQGPWIYATVDDGQVGLDERDYLAIGTLESYMKIRDYYGADVVVPVYITVDDGIRLERALERERRQKEPKYQELCRRFLADEKDFSNENLKKCGVSRSYVNDDLDRCVQSIKEMIKGYSNSGCI